jgi:hypothetical protein
MCMIALNASDRAMLIAANRQIGVLEVAPKHHHGTELRGQRVLVTLGPEARMDLGANQVMVWWDDFRTWCSKQRIDVPVSPSLANDCSESIACYAAA